MVAQYLGVSWWFFTSQISFAHEHPTSIAILKMFWHRLLAITIWLLSKSFKSLLLLINTAFNTSKWKIWNWFTCLYEKMLNSSQPDKEENVLMFNYLVRFWEVSWAKNFWTPLVYLWFWHVKLLWDTNCCSCYMLLVIFVLTLHHIALKDTVTEFKAANSFYLFEFQLLTKRF